MANVTVTPGKSGPIEVLVQLEDGDEKPLAADRVSVTLSNEAQELPPSQVKPNDCQRQLARSNVSGVQREMVLSLAIVLGQNDHIEMTAPILIE